MSAYFSTLRLRTFVQVRQGFRCLSKRLVTRSLALKLQSEPSVEGNVSKTKI